MSKQIDYEQLDLELQVLAGENLSVNTLEIRPKNLREIIKYGYSKYSKHLGIISLNVADLTKGVDDVEQFEMGATVFDIILASGDSNLILQFVSALAYFLDEESFIFDDELGLVFGEVKQTKEETLEKCKVINHLNYNEVADIIRYQNCVKMPKADSYNPADEKARQIIEKLKKGKETVEKVKAKDGSDNIDFQSVVSSVSTKSNSINKLNVWDLTIYQLYDEFKRLEMINGYETSILAMLNGADIRDLKHWANKIED